MVLDAAGDYEETRLLPVAMTVVFEAVCCDLHGNCKVSNPATLTVEVCGPAASPAPSPVASPLPSPFVTPSPVPLACESVAYPMCELGACPSGQHCLHKEAAVCACYPIGDSSSPNFGYASCEAAKIALGKDQFVTGVSPPITSLAMCEAYGQSYCQQFGGVPPVFGGEPPWYVTLVDWAPDCCIWSCSGNFG